MGQIFALFVNYKLEVIPADETIVQPRCRKTGLPERFTAGRVNAGSRQPALENRGEVPLGLVRQARFSVTLRNLNH